MRTILRSICASALLLTLFVGPGTPGALAQDGKGGSVKFKFGPPLRNNILFAYKYTERVRAIHSIDGAPYDSSERVLTYFITQRQVPVPEKAGVIDVQVLVDSMQLDYRHPSDTFFFDTQKLSGEEWNMVKHREVLVPSALVNRMVVFRLSPYGEVLSLKSEALDEVRRQASEPGVDIFTQTLVAGVTSDEYLTSVLLPWRGVVPLGREVRYDRPVTLPFFASLDRVSFKEKVTSYLEKKPDGELHLRFDATLARPHTKMMTITSFDEALKVKSTTATMTGDLKLDEDGVVHSGWSVAKGTIMSDRGGSKIRSDISHEIYIESIGLSPLTSN